MRTLITLIFTVSFFTTNAQNWNYDLPTVQKLAKEQNKKILLVFQGSNWCAPCMKLEKEIWNSVEFQDYAKKHLVLLKADFPKKKSNQLSKEQQNKNDLLAEKYNQSGYFPLVVILDKNGKVLGTTGYKSLSPAEYVKLLSSF